MLRFDGHRQKCFQPSSSDNYFTIAIAVFCILKKEEPILLIPLPLDSAISSTLAFFGFLPLVDFLFSLSVFSAYKK
jgi:hypothetical protein